MHASTDDAPVTFWYLPAAHEDGVVVDGCAQYWPTGQEAGCVMPPTEQKVPAGHGVHALPPVAVR